MEEAAAGGDRTGDKRTPLMAPKQTPYARRRARRAAAVLPREALDEERAARRQQRGRAQRASVTSVRRARAKAAYKQKIFQNSATLLVTSFIACYAFITPHAMLYDTRDARALRVRYHTIRTPTIMGHTSSSVIFFQRTETLEPALHASSNRHTREQWLIV